MIHFDHEPESLHPILQEKEDTSAKPHHATDAQEIFPFDVTSVESNCPGEDRNSFVIKGNVACWAVVDGHGGSTACDIVNKSITSDIVDRILGLPTLDSPDEIVSIVDDCFQLCDKAVLDDALGRLQAIDDPKDTRTELMRIREAGRPGCCVVVVVIVGDLLFTANVGCVTTYACLLLTVVYNLMMYFLSEIVALFVRRRWRPSPSLPQLSLHHRTSNLTRLASRRCSQLKIVFLIT
jgi:hypothetical protein